MWINLQSMHEYTNRLVLMGQLHMLWNITANKGTNIADHLSRLKCMGPDEYVHQSQLSDLQDVVQMHYHVVVAPILG